jgi:TatD DNase family protein
MWPRMTNPSTADFSLNATTVSPELIDIGINLTHDSYDSDRDAVLARAAAAGVTQMVVTGASADSSHKAAALARAHPGRLFATAGVHPHHATEVTDAVAEQLEQLARQPAVVAVGECGLDYFRDFSPRDVQRAAFARQLEIAARVGKPVFLHQRDAHDDFIAILREHRAALAAGAVAHCFTGTAAELAAYLDLGLAIGITGWINDERRGAHLLPLMREIPAERLMVETDGPYLLPRDLNPKPASRRNEPAYLPHIAATVARARGERFEQLAASSTAAARRFFRLPKPPHV